MQPSNLEAIATLLREIEEISEKIRFHLVANNNLNADGIDFLDNLYQKKGVAINRLNELSLKAKFQNLEISDDLKSSISELIKEDKHLLDLIEIKTKELGSKIKVNQSKKNLLIYKR